MDQVAASAKNSESPAAKTLLGFFGLDDVIVTLDARGAWTNTVKMSTAQA